MFEKKINYSLDEVSIIPAVTGKNSRKECNPFIDGINKLPIFCAPMQAVCDEHNFFYFMKNGITPIIPRNIDIATRMKCMKDYQLWVAFGLEEFREVFVEKLMITTEFKHYVYRVCIDIANGHIRELPELISIAKKNYPNTEIMAGNVANPDTFAELSRAGADYIRVGIGGGACCLTSTNTGVHFPMASLIDECKNRKHYYGLTAKIVADGGIDDYGKAMKALALGADYVMMGTMLAKCYESAAEPTFMYADYLWREFYHNGLAEKSISNFMGDGLWKNMLYDSSISEDEKRDNARTAKARGFTKTIYGMSTPQAQQAIDESKPVRPTEGLEREIPIEYTVNEFAENFKAYLRSAMAYTNYSTLGEFQSGYVTLNVLNNKCYKNNL